MTRLPIHRLLPRPRQPAADTCVRRLRLGAGVLVVAVLAGCGQDNAPPPADAAGAQPAPAAPVAEPQPEQPSSGFITPETLEAARSATGAQVERADAVAEAAGATIEDPELRRRAQEKTAAQLRQAAEEAGYSTPDP